MSWIKLVKLLIAKDHVISKSNVLVLGITFKEDCPDIRNSKVIDIVNELQQFNINVDVFDPHADKHEVLEEYGITLIGNHLLCWGPNSIQKKRNGSGLPDKVIGPFRQVSVGPRGVCVITEADNLKCWGIITRFIDEKKFSAWDQINIGAQLSCGVSMDSELECFGADIFPVHYREHHKKFVVA